LVVITTLNKSCIFYLSESRMVDILTMLRQCRLSLDLLTRLSLNCLIRRVVMQLGQAQPVFATWSLKLWLNVHNMVTFESSQVLI